MKIKPKHKNKTFAIFATLFFTLTLILTVAPVSSNLVNADTLTSYYSSNIPFSLVEFINGSDYKYSAIPIPQLFSYTSDNPVATSTSTNDNHVVADTEVVSLSFANDNTFYGQSHYFFDFESPVLPYVSFSASNFIISPYTSDFKYSYINHFPYVRFGNYDAEGELANQLDISIDYCSFLNYNGGAYDVYNYSFTRTFDYDDDAEYYELLDSIMNELQTRAYSNFSSSTPVYVLDFTLAFNANNYESHIEFIDVVFGDSFTSYNYYLKSYDLFTATYFNANYEFSWFESIVNSVNEFLQIEFLPDFSFGDLLFCVIAIPLAIWLLKLWLGG